MPSRTTTSRSRSRDANGPRLVIVESPTKAAMIGRFLGDGYVVKASMGHVRDLPKSKIGVDTTSFEPTYQVATRAKEIIADLKKQAANAPTVILAPDPDREGEAIAWHLAAALDVDTTDTARVQRITFHEITKEAVQEALEHPRQIDQHLVDAQQARRVLDRLVGYELSPFLWRKIRYGLSAGRVQSVAVRLIVEREREITSFTAQEYWSIDAIFGTASGDTLTAKLHSLDGTQLDKFALGSADAAQSRVDRLRTDAYHVAALTTKEVRRNPAAPFTTSTLQQEASRKLGFSAKQTMTIAQKLYERGAITYMRTDSVSIGEGALRQAREVITDQFGAAYALETPRRYATKSKGAQEAHEAVRPTDLRRTPKQTLSGDRGEMRLYDLIWKRTIASQMTPAVLDQTSVDIANADATALFRATGQTVRFDGFIRVYTEGSDDAGDDASGTLPPLKTEESLTLNELTPNQHFTEPPARYTDATLVKALEAHGVGRPSTYAPTLTTIQDRGYVEKIEKKYQPTETGTLVTDFLVQHFPEIVDINFTSHIEEELDDIAEGTIDWREVCREFYEPFKQHLIEKEETVAKHVEVSTTPCPHCQQPMLMKFGRNGKFLACPEPGSKITQPMPEEAAQIAALEEKTRGELCPICGKALLVRRGRFGFFLGCVDYPKCKGVSKIWNRIGFTCPHCPAEGRSPVGDVVERKGRGRGKPFYGCTKYPDCTFTTNTKAESAEQLAALYEAWLKAPKGVAKKRGSRTTARTSAKRTATTKRAPRSRTARASGTTDALSV